MTLQEFSTLHPKIIHYERVGVEGIDLESLHKKIEKSRYLKSRQSFVYLAKNYKDILDGKFDDFKLEIEPEKPKHDEKTLKQIERLKLCLKMVKSIPNDENISQLCRRTIDMSFQEFIQLLEKAIDYPAWAITAFMKYNDFLGMLKDYGYKIQS